MVQKTFVSEVNIHYFMYLNDLRCHFYTYSYLIFNYTIYLLILSNLKTIIQL